MDNNGSILVWITILLLSAGSIQSQSRSSDYQPMNGVGDADGIGVGPSPHHQDFSKPAQGLFPSVFNLAADAEVTSNATCGQSASDGPEIYCRLVEHVYVREPQCGVCDDKDPEYRHPIGNVIDGTNSRWQSPTLQNGRRFEWVTITLDLKQVFQVAYVVVKSAISPRPGNWILERSLDGVTFLPWQYYALSDAECISRYGIEPREGNPTYRSDSEVICTAFYSKLDPLEDGEIHTSLIKGRPGARLPSAELLEFTKARYVRLRLQKIRTLNADLMSKLSSKNLNSIGDQQQSEADRSLYQRLFYSIKDISIGGQCVCNGHASACPYHSEVERAQCRCEHNTCGSNCERCCPLFNQRPWKAGTMGEAAVCEQCQCHGHAHQCRYDPQVDKERRSLSIHNIFQGGGVCLNCTDFTTGINCEKCLDGYFRPAGSTLTAPCLPCGCHPDGSSGSSCTDGSIQDSESGQCQCRVGFAGSKCDRCASGYHSFPNCEPCGCDTAGISDPGCRSPCQCKSNVEGERCDRCRPGFFDLRQDNPEGCSRCFCFDRSGRCVAADLGLTKISSKIGWLVTDLQGRRVVTPTAEQNEKDNHINRSRLSIANDDMADFESYYWLAPPDYLGKKLTAYSQLVKFHVAWVKARGDSAGKATKGPDVIMEGGGMKIGYGDRSYHRDSNTTITWALRESKHWYHIPDTVADIVRRRRTEYKGEAVTKTQLMTVLNDLRRLLVRAKFHTDQIEGVLHDAELDVGSEHSASAERARGIEQCFCPPGYAGLSCEDCAFGYVRRNSSRRGEFECLACQCNGHAATCDVDDLTACSPCLHSTVGRQCDACAAGYYGDARSGGVCKRCRCPLDSPAGNNFSPTCLTTGPDSYVCDQCPPGYEGHHCQRCADGYYGNPLVAGGFCQPCDCSSNHEIGSSDWCDRLTGQCLKCKTGTAGQSCQLCATGYYGNATEGTCQECRCYSQGSASIQCDTETGQCQCRDRFTGRHCNRCKDGYGDMEAGCRDCQCDLVGSLTASTCDVQTGQCNCKPGVGGLACNQCLPDHYDFSVNGCRGEK